MQPDRRVIVTVTNRTIFRAILWILGTILVFKFLGEVSNILTLIFTAFFLALALNPIVGWMSQRLNIKSRVRATAAAYFSVIIIIAGFFAIVTPPLVVQSRDFIRDVPQLVEDFQKGDSSIARAVARYDLDAKLTNAAKEFASQYSNFGGTLLNTGKRVIQTIASVIAVLVMTFMMLVEGPRWLRLVKDLLPSKKRTHYQGLAYKMYKAVSGFVLGQVLLALLAGTMTLISLTIASQALNIPVNALALAGIVAVFALIPLFGNLISATIVVLVSAISSLTLGLIMLVIFIVYQQIENVSIQPFIQSRATRLTPLTVFVAALAGVSFKGLLGAIVAIPVAAALKILFEDQLERRGIRTHARGSK